MTMLITIHHQIDKFGGKMNNPCRKPSGPYLIESTPEPQYRRYKQAKAAREIFQRIFLPLEIVSSAVSGYRNELNHLLDAPAIYLGPGK